MAKPTISMAMFNSYGSHNQRVYPIKSHETIIFLWFSYGFPPDSTAKRFLSKDPHRSQLCRRLGESHLPVPDGLRCAPLLAPQWTAATERLPRAAEKKKANHGKTMGKWWFNGISMDLSSGRRVHSYGKSPCSLVNPLSMVHFQ